jgi:hypothetical protein
VVDVDQPTGGDGLEQCRIAVADGGRIVKLSLHHLIPLGATGPVARRVIAELVRQSGQAVR